MKYCTQCGFQLKDDVRFCTNCGYEQKRGKTESDHATLRKGVVIADKNHGIIRNDLKKLKEKYIAIDFETTGLSPTMDRIVEIGAITFENGRGVSSFNSLVNPHVMISSQATAVNHITNEMIQNAPEERVIFQKLVDYLGEAIKGEIILCAHNASFDMSFLSNTLSRLGYNAHFQYIDTLSLSKSLLNWLPNYKQPTVASALSISIRDEHRALSDAVVCGRILWELLAIEEKRRITNVEKVDLYRKTNEAELPNKGLAIRKTGLGRQVSTLRVHEDLEKLLWIADGPKKNYTQEKNCIARIDLGDRVLSINFSGAQEPSLISTKAVVNVDSTHAEKVSYFPSYLELSPDQKGIYWKFLENPYNPSFEIGYVFVLYYGLERHLLLGDYEKAINVIIKLRDVHENKSFQSYSANAIILTCLKNKRADLLYNFLNSLDKEYEYRFSDNLYLFSKYSLDLPLNANDVMRMAKSFEYTKTTYIKNYPELFNEILTGNMIEAIGAPEFLCSQFIKKADFKKLPKESVQIFANVSIIDQRIEVPLMIHAFHLKRVMYDLLNKTHEDIKKQLAEMRKNGTLPQKK